MKFWICTKCGLVHGEEVMKCECGMPFLALLFVQWIYFDSVEALEEWIAKMKKYLGAKLKYAGD